MSNITFSVNAVTRYDPTRTLVLRNNFARRFRVQFNDLALSVRNAIVDNGILNTQNTPAERVAFFMGWFDRQVGAGPLDSFLARRMGTIVTESWMNTYIQSAYQRGILRARQELRNSVRRVPTIDESGGMAVVFNQPQHLNMVDLLYARVYNELQGVSAFMSQQVSRVLAQALAENLSNSAIAQSLTQIIVGPARQRAQLLARTEIIRAYHTAVVQEYRNWGVEGVRVEAEWVTADDDRVCGKCEPLEGNVYSLNEIEGMIPLHVQCRCVAIPVAITKN
jgi:SPP1 gp7 family putative phage head morphogenesis protein